MKMQMSFLIGLALGLAATQAGAGTTRPRQEPEQGVAAHAPAVEVTSTAASPVTGPNQSPDNRTQQQIGQPGNDVTKTIKSKKSDAGFPYGSSDHGEEYRKFSGVRYTPLDLAEYILRTRDEEGVALAIEELLREGLINRDEAILYLETVKKELQTLKARYEHEQETTKAPTNPHRIPQLRVQPHPAYEAKRKGADPKRSEADAQRVQTPHSLFREQQEQEQLQQQRLQQQQIAEQRAKQLEQQEQLRQEQMQLLQDQFQQEQEQQEEQLRQQQQEQLRQQQQEQLRQQQQEQLRQQQQIQQQKIQQQQEQKQQLPLQLAKLVKVKSENQKQPKPELLTNKTPKQPAKVYNATGLKHTAAEQQPQQQATHQQPQEQAAQPQQQTQAEKQAYDDYLLENVIYQLAKDMFSQSMVRDNASAEQLLSRFASFLEGELADKRFSKEAQNKIMDTVSAALVESLRERLYLEN